MGKVRLGFVGCGGIAESHMKGIAKHPDAEILGFCDINETKAKDMAQKYGVKGARVYTDAEVMFKDIELDGAYFCLPPFAHGSELYAIEAGIPFFVEKPINLYLRDDPPILVLGGWIGGTPKAGPGGGIWSWWIIKDKSGGQFHEQVTHTVDLTRFLCGEVVEVHAFAAKGLNKGAPENYSIEDASVVNLKFKGGAVANLWASCSANAGGGGVTLSIYANSTTALFTGWEHSLRLLRQGEEEQRFPGEPNIFEIEDDAFIRAIKDGDSSPIMCDYEDGLGTLKVTLAANESMSTGKPVHIG